MVQQGAAGTAGATGPQGPQGLMGVPGPAPPNVAFTNTTNSFAGNQTINGNVVRGAGGSIQFAE